ncbi:MAG: MoaD/ThiS family protein [Nocardioidaceae bacterium]
MPDASITSSSSEAAEPVVTVRYWAAARAAAGRETDRVEAGTLAQVLGQVHALHEDSARFARVVAMCSILVGESPVGGADPATVTVPPGGTVELLPPFAGGSGGSGGSAGDLVAGERCHARRR